MSVTDSWTHDLFPKIISFETIIIPVVIDVHKWDSHNREAKMPIYIKLRKWKSLSRMTKPQLYQNVLFLSYLNR